MLFRRLATDLYKHFYISSVFKLTLLSFADVKTAVKNKVPLVRSLTLNWLTFCLETSNKALILKAHKEYVPLCMEVSIFVPNGS